MSRNIGLLGKRVTRAVATAWLAAAMIIGLTPPRVQRTANAEVVGRGWTDRAICLSCIAGVLAASGTGSVLAVMAVIAEMSPTLSTGCLYACSQWNS